LTTCESMTPPLAASALDSCSTAARCASASAAASAWLWPSADRPMTRAVIAMPTPPPRAVQRVRAAAAAMPSETPATRAAALTPSRLPLVPAMMPDTRRNVVSTAVPAETSPVRIATAAVVIRVPSTSIARPTTVAIEAIVCSGSGSESSVPAKVTKICASPLIAAARAGPNAAPRTAPNSVSPAARLSSSASTWSRPRTAASPAPLSCSRAITPAQTSPTWRISSPKVSIPCRPMVVSRMMFSVNSCSHGAD